MINITDETVLPLARAAKTLPRKRNGKPTHTATLYRWSSAGLRGIKLEVIRVGGCVCTSTEALQRFFDRLTESDTRRARRRRPQQMEAAASGDRQRESAGGADAAEVERQLDELGFTNPRPR